MMDRENEIRLIAYHIWEEEGCPDGKDGEHWIRAEAIWEVDNSKKPSSAAKRKTAASGAGKASGKKASSVKKASKK